MLKNLSITARLSLFFAVTSIVALSGIGAFLYRALEGQFAQNDTTELVGKVELVRHIVSNYSSREEIMLHPERLDPVVIGHSSLHLTVKDEDGKVLFASSTLSLPADEWHAEETVAMPWRTQLWQTENKRTYRTLTAWAKLAPKAQKRVLIALALDNTYHQSLLRIYLRTLIGAVVVASVFAAGAGYLIAKEGLAPLREVARTAHRISAEHLSERLDARSIPRELQQLATAFNAMLERLEDSFQRLAAFSSDLAHELRTPISNLMGQTQVTLTRSRTADQYRVVLESNLEECDRLSRMIDNMLFLAKADHAQALLELEPVDLRAELDRVVDFYDALTLERGVTISCKGEGSVNADRTLVQRAISNLLSNAIRYTPRDGRIDATVGIMGGDVVSLSVNNSGPPIPDEHISRLFDRFYRVDHSRSDPHPGSGLGLAIVKSIMTLHGGNVTASSSREQGTTFTLIFPKDLSIEPRYRQAEQTQVS